MLNKFALVIHRHLFLFPVTQQDCAQGYALVGSGNFGRRCSAPFTCTNGIDENVSMLCCLNFELYIYNS